MTDIQNVTSTTGAGGAGAGPLGAAASDGESITDYDDFLTLLVAQLENQDPLQPQDSNEWVAQLATFTSVEQQMASNDKLDQLIAAQNNDQINTLANWVGQEITTDGVSFDFSGGTIDLPTPEADGADRVYLSLRDERDIEIARLEVDGRGGTAVWDGRDNAGQLAPAGLYSIAHIFETDTANGVEARTEIPTGGGAVAEARIDADGAVQLVLGEGPFVAEVTDVLSVREPAAATLATATEDDSSLLDDAVDVVSDVVEAAEETVQETVEAVVS